MRYELKIALRYLKARRKEAFVSVTTLFTAIGVTIGVAALIVTLAVMQGFEASLQQRILALSPQIQILSTRGSITGYRAIQSRIAKVADISGSDPFVVGQAMLSSGRGIGGVVVRGIEPGNPVVVSEWSRYIVRGGLGDLARDYGAAAGAEAAPTEGALAIGVTLAAKLKVAMGDRVRMVAPILGLGSRLTTRSGEFVVGAVFDSGMTFLDAHMVFMDLLRAQNFFGRGGKADGIDVHLKSLAATGRVAGALRRMLAAPYRVHSWIEYNRSAAAGFAMLRRVYAIVLTLLIAVAAFNLIATLIMVVMEKRRDIAVLLAMGATPGQVRLVFVLKGLMVGAAGTLAGIAVGAFACFALARYRFIRIPREIYGIATLPIAADPMSFAWVAALSMLLCLLATIYPARQASRETPVEVFRD